MRLNEGGGFVTLRGWLALLIAVALAIALCTGNPVCWLIACAGVVVLWIERRSVIDTTFPNSGDFDV